MDRRCVCGDCHVIDNDPPETQLLLFVYRTGTLFAVLSIYGC